MWSWLKRLGWLTAGGAVTAAIVYSFLPEPIPVDVGKVVRGPLEIAVEEDGKTRIKQRYIVSAPLSGQLLRINLRAGDPVQSGQTILATILPVEASLLDARAVAQAEAKVKSSRAAAEQAVAQLNGAQAALDFAQAELRRFHELFIRKTTTRQDLEEREMHERMRREELSAAKSGQAVARFELELSEAALVRSRPNSASDENEANLPLEIRASISGKILRVFQESSTVVTPGMQLLEIGDPSDLEAEVDVLSSDGVRIQPGDRVLFQHWGGAAALPGRVRLIEPAAFLKVSALGVEEQRVNVIADFEGDLDQRTGLGDAFRVEARIIVWSGEDLLKVPMSALFRQGEDWAVFRVVNERAERHIVRIGHRNGIEAEVLDGLRQNDVVIEHPSDRVRDGVAIAIRR